MTEKKLPRIYSDANVIIEYAKMARFPPHPATERTRAMAEREEKCVWCGETIDEHGEDYEGRPVPKMPCLGLRQNFTPSPKASTAPESPSLSGAAIIDTEQAWEFCQSKSVPNLDIKREGRDKVTLVELLAEFANGAIIGLQHDSPCPECEPPAAMTREEAERKADKIDKFYRGGYESEPIISKRRAKIVALLQRQPVSEREKGLIQALHEIIRNEDS